MLHDQTTSLNIQNYRKARNGALALDFHSAQAASKTDLIEKSSHWMNQAFPE